MSQRLSIFLLLSFVLPHIAAFAQTVAIANAGFDEGADAPTGWAISGGTGEWIAEGESGKAISVTGAGADPNFWRSDPVPFEPSKAYRLQFRARGFGATGGTAIAGPEFCNRDLGQLTDAWQTFTSYFVSPTEVVAENAWLRLGQFQVTGKIAFDALSVVRVQPVYLDFGGPQLGDGESITGNEYVFAAPFADAQTNQSRPLAGVRCRFNTNRWVFVANDVVSYTHFIATRRQNSGRVEIVVEPFNGGKLSVLADNGTAAPQEIGAITAAGSHAVAVPAALFPAERITITLAAQPVDGNADAVSMQVRGYTYKAVLDGAPLTAVGKTAYWAMPTADPRLQIEIAGLGSAVPGGQNALTAQIVNTSPDAIPTTPTLTITRAGQPPENFAQPMLIAMGNSTVQVPYQLRGGGIHDLVFTMGDGVPARFEGQIDVPTLYNATFGEVLPLSGDVAGLWWAPSGSKVSKTHPMPAVAGERVLIRAAKNESEAAQLIVRPSAEIGGFVALGAALTGPGGAVIPETNVSVLRVRYVQTEQATDESTVVGQWPDPLPPASTPIALAGGQNQPLWVRVTVPPGVPAGNYEGTVALRGNAYAVDVPIRVEVFDFELPTRPTCTTTFGFNPELVFKYHRVSDPAQKRQVLDLYWKNFSAHRIAPYNPAPLDPMGVTWPNIEAYKSGANTDMNAAFTPAIDWAAWDGAMTPAMETYGFNSFVVPVQGMGGGTFHSRTEPTLLGYAEASPEYAMAFANYHRAVQEHLREKNWLDRGYVYWFDEPDPKDYEFVNNGFRKLKEAAPDIRRMLTEQPDPALVGPNIWCPISDAVDQAKADERMAQGDTFWWYVCTGPKAPYCTLFLDHPSLELRVWLWQTWQRKISGILVWQSNYWTSDAAYPDPNAPQDPYVDPMSWMSGYDTQANTKKPWGNGDGRFIYPPESASVRQGEPILEGPVDSIRWEMLRDGVEDYEYLAILRRLIGEKEQAGKDVAQYKTLLDVPPAITTSAKEFTTDPAVIDAQRLAIAKAIEAASKL